MRLDTSAGDARMKAAEAKRARKAAKRRRDAELTRLGMGVARGVATARNAVRPSSERWDEGVFWSEAAEVGLLRDRMLAIRRGEVQP